MKFLQKLFGIVDKSEEQGRLIEEKFNSLQEKVLAEVANLRNENAALKSEAQRKDNRITELLTKVRDQNEADLLIEVKRIEKRIMEGEKRENINTNALSALQSMNNAYNQQLAAQQSGSYGRMPRLWDGFFG